MENNSINEKTKNLKNDKKVSKSMNFLKKNKALFGLISRGSIFEANTLVLCRFPRKDHRGI